LPFFQFARHHPESGAIDHHGHAEGTGGQLLAIQAVTCIRNQWLVGDFVIHVAALAGSAGGKFHLASNDRPSLNRIDSSGNAAFAKPEGAL
jgi:hypothetical protein